ncbi:MAG: glutamine-hydrolyzing carbamoyl-phosphate synthase small subunit [Clostridia bacterium]|nr:glutamine-hydrolyzing carbamoyl-phosphate synthase small subunit [Clostridia bacterium]
MKKAYLVLANGKVFEGKRFGADASVTGELVFTTGVVGYLENLTDPNYYGQIILQTFPLIGNYGVIEEDVPTTAYAAGYVVREWCDAPSNFRSQYDLDKYLKDHNIPGIYGIDTREVTRTIRECGVMPAMICDEIPADLSALAAYEIKGAVAAVTPDESATLPAAGEELCRVTVISYGSCAHIADALMAKGATVTVLPFTATAEDVLATAPDGIVLSEGPGDPRENVTAIETVKALIGKAPIFGVGMGHQILALAMGGKCEKMHHGHRGGNQPVKELTGIRTYMTTQNHGYTVLADSVKATEIYRNVNDGTCEGLCYYPAVPAQSVQFTPVYGNGPHDTSFLYTNFIETVIKSKKAGEC